MPSVVNGWQTGPFLSPGYVRRSEDRLSEPRFRPQAWSGMALAPGGRRTWRSAQGTRNLAYCAFREEFISSTGRVSRGPHGQNWRPPSSEYSISNRPDKLLGTHPLNWFPLRYRYDRLACPTPAVSPRLAGSRRGPEIPGWRGCPTPAVSPRSTRSRGGPALSGWRGCPTTGYLTAQLVVAEDQLFQAGEVVQLRRYLPAQLVIAEVQPRQVGEVAPLRRYLPAQLVLA